MRQTQLTLAELKDCELVALDPSLRCPGVAVYRCGALVASTSIRQDTTITGADVLGARITATARSVLEWLSNHTTRPRALFVEWPQVYAAVKSKGDPNDLLAVAGVGAAVATMLASYVYQSARGVLLDVRFVSPAQWAGQLPKTEKKSEVWNAPRTRRIVSRLDRDEKQVVTMQHDVIDAIGIGLFALGRMAPTRVFPGATVAPTVIDGI